MILTLHFCVKCGTKIYKEITGDAFKGLLIVQAGTLDGGGEGEMGLEDVKVQAELWVKERVGWVKERADAKQMSEFE